LADFGFEDSDEILHLRFAQAGIHRRPQMEPELPLRARHAGKGGNGRQLPALAIQDVPGEDIGEEMFLEKLSMTGVKSW
jgi:hypothetical protein